MSLVKEAPVPLYGSLSPDGNYFLAGSWKDWGFSLWDISHGAHIRNIAAESSTVLGIPLGIPVAFTPDGKYAWAGGKFLKLWELSSGNEIRTMGNRETAQLSLSADGRRALVKVDRALTMYTILYDVTSGQIINERKEEYRRIALSADGKYALGGGLDGYMDFWMASTGKTMKRFDTTRSGGGILSRWAEAVAFSSDYTKALSGNTDGTIKLWDLFSGSELLSIKGHTGVQGVMAVNFSPDGKYILSGGGSDGFLKLWDINTGREIRSFRVFSRDLMPAPVVYASFSRDGKRIISLAADASIRIWDTATGGEIGLLIAFEDGEWLVITSDGYYNSSEKGAQYLRVKYEGSDYSVDQFYDVFYRPDIVAAKMSGQDMGGLISITMKDASKSPPPSVEFTKAPSDTDQCKVKVCYKAKSAGGGIGEVRLFHNGKLIQSDGYYRDAAKVAVKRTELTSLDSTAIYEDIRSVSIKGTVDSIPLRSKSKGDSFEECKEVELIPGENEVSVTAFNGNNTIQSYMKTVRFSSKQKSDDPHLYILSIGIDRYKNNSVNLKYAAKDASDIEEKLKTQAATLYKPKNIHYALLTDKEATKANITNKIDDLAKTIKPQDNFILFVAGHGVLLQNQYYMLTHDFDGRVSDESMISSNEIVEASKKIKSLSQLLIFDTCHAGGVDYIVSGLYDARMSVLAKKMGLHIYASASDKQSAMDGYKGNGLFTYTLLDGLNNNKEADKKKEGKVTIVGLGEYAKKATTDISKQIGQSQTPLIINFGKDSPIYKLQ